MSGGRGRACHRTSARLADARVSLDRAMGGACCDAFLADLAAARYGVACLEPNDYATVAALEEEYGDLEPGLADLSVVVIARRVATRRIATFDERDFRALRSLEGDAFTLLPKDA